MGGVGAAHGAGGPMTPLRPRMKPRSYRRWKRQLAQLERRRGLANDTVFLAALHGAMRASFKAHPEAMDPATAREIEEFVATDDGFAAPGNPFGRAAMAMGVPGGPAASFTSQIMSRLGEGVGRALSRAAEGAQRLGGDGSGNQ